MQLNAVCQKRKLKLSFNAQTLRCMKITAFILLAICLHVSAATLAQTVTLNEHKAPLEKVINSIKQQTGYSFFYNQEWLRQAQPVDLSVKNQPLDEVLKICFKNQPFDYAIVNKTIVLKLKEKASPNLPNEQSTAPPVTVTGKVTDETGQPLPGVTVKIKSTGGATATDNKGAFTITVPNDQETLIFSYIGYETRELPTDKVSIGSAIVLRPITTNLQEVVVDKGYYKVKQRENTGDVNVVFSKEIGEQPVHDPLAALEGRVAGVYISQTGSALPGMAFTVRLMGKNSIPNNVSNNDPLYIVDGVPFSSTPLSQTSAGGGNLSALNNLSNSDIENIEILKDADATAIYGSRGSNGVVLITTKKGKAGKTKVTIDISQGASSQSRKIDLLNTQQYLQMRRQAFANDGLLVPSIKTNPTDANYDINGTWDTTRYTDWQKVIYANPAKSANLSASVSGGNTNTQFLISTGYNKLSSFLPGDFNDTKESLLLNLNHSSDDRKFQIVSSLSYVNDNNFLPAADPISALTLAPDAPPLYDANGNLNWANGTWTNPFAALQQTVRQKTDNFIGNMNLSYEPISGLQISTNLGGNYLQSFQNKITPFISINPSFATSNNRTVYNANINQKVWIVEPKISYTHNIGDGRLDFLIGSTFQQNLTIITGITGSNFTSDALLNSVSNASSFSGISYNQTQYNYAAAYTRLGYTYHEKYLLNITARRDGSSRFGPGNQFGNFGAIGAGWIFSRERFISDNLKFLSFGKLRASYGTTGSDQIGDYRYLSVYSPLGGNTYQGSSIIYPSQIGNNDFGWELDKKLNFGLDLGLLKDRVQVTVAYYRNRTSSQLLNYSLPTITGFSSIQANLAAEVQNSGWEFTATTSNIKSRNFTWITSFNLTSPRNKLLAYPGLAGSSLANTYVIGQSLFIQKQLYHYTGLNSQTGLYTFQDVNSDGKISSPQDYVANKTLTQDFFGGFQNSFTYKGIQLDVFFQFVKQTGTNYLGNFTFPGFFSSASSNQPTLILGNSSLEKLTSSASSNLASAYSLYRNSDAKIQDASFIRLKNVALSYQLPAPLVQKAHLQSLRFFIQCQNLLTITGYQGVDPENQGATPPMRTIQAGFSLGL